MSASADTPFFPSTFRTGHKLPTRRPQLPEHRLDCSALRGEHNHKTALLTSLATRKLTLVDHAAVVGDFLGTRERNREAV